MNKRASKQDSCGVGDLSPSKIRVGRNGRMYVTRLSIQCICGRTFSVLMGNGHEMCARCPKCKKHDFSAQGNRNHSEITFAISEVR